MENLKKVTVWEESCSIPTYKVYPPEKNPLFIEKRAYQGSTGKVYPLPVTEKISDEKEDVTYQAVYLENDYLKVMILPELGGRIHRAYDKTNDYDFVYYNHVIKPALVGLTGPWISGGIEFNWPQHHRPSTYCPVDYTLSENKDGSCTVYVSEIDKMYGTKGMAAITIYPDKAYIEIKGQLYNPTDLPQTFLWWANPAVPVNDHTYSVFPPDVNAVMDHGKRAVSTFPIATGEYYKWDYSEGVDISRYKNVKVPTSYMAAHSGFDFIGNYDENIEAGLLHVADHHISPGKKQWTWGNGDFGRTWDRNLTETDGPYIELMTGVFTDNQPDFTWLKPHEEKSFVQYFMPYKKVGRVGNATKDAMVSISEASGNTVSLKVYTTGTYENVHIKVNEGDSLLFETVTELSPTYCFEAAIPTPQNMEQCVVQVTCESKCLVEYSVYKNEIKPIPEPAEALKAPVDLKSIEELYLAGTHLEQYRHATYEPADYYLEGLRRDPTDIRLNNSYGLLLLRRGHISESISYFEAAVKKQTWKNPNPYSGECYFNLGLAYDANGETDKAYDAFFKSTWSSETQSSGFYWLACIASRMGDYELSLEFVEKSLLRNWHNLKARTLKAALLRKTNKDNTQIIQDTLAIDPLCMGCLYEQALTAGNLESWVNKMRADVHNYLVLSLDYTKSGLYDDALFILKSYAGNHPLRDYYQGYILELTENKEEAVICYKKGESGSADYCFPNRIEELAILEHAISTLDLAPKAHYYLGNLLYDKKQYDKAAEHWETSVLESNTLVDACQTITTPSASTSPKENPSSASTYCQEDSALAGVCRNLAIYYFNKKNDASKAMDAMKKACSLDSCYPRLWLEYDQLAAKTNVSIQERIAVMEGHMDITQARDDLYLRYITLLNCTRRYEEALSALMSHHFHPWEGGEGKTSAQYKYALIQIAKKELQNNNLKDALTHLTDSLAYPDNLGEGKLPNVPDNEAYYYMGIAYRMMGDDAKSHEYFTMATSGSQEPGSVLYYNDQPSDYIFYQGLAHLELDNKAAALKSFHQLIIYGEKHVFDHVAYDFFAVSLPEIEIFQDDIQLRNSQYCNYLRGLGHLGLKENDKADRLFEEIIAKQPDYQGAITHKSFL